MAKRKAGVNDIIYELDNEDISSDDEVKDPKINRLETVNSINPIQIDINTEETCIEDNDINKSSKEVVNIPSPANMENGGKSSDELDKIKTTNCSDTQQNGDEVDCVKKTSTDCCKTTILNEDIVIDSPGNSDLGVEGCENRTPLVTIRFRDNRLACNYKEQIKAFMLNLIKIHEGETIESENETDLELDIWPEDLSDEPVEVENNLFFVDTDPGDERATDIPRYSQASTLMTNIPEKERTPPPARRGFCFNCDGDHPLRDCTLPKDFGRIANKRKSLPVRVGRYHVEDEQKFGHLIPGRISGQLRHALGLKRHELPLHIYRMRVLGYPPGWLEDARISHSGITMFDSLGNAILEPEEEEGEVCEPGSKDKFDIKKILDFPGFNVPASPRYKEEAHAIGLPPMSDQDSKLAMLQFLAPNAMKAYKRKKLTMFPSTASNNTTLEGQAEMELDSDNEIMEFPSVPPLPDEAPPPLPPPPPPPPASPPPLPPLPPEEQEETDDKSSGDDVEVIEVLRVGDIPVPMADFIVIDEDDGSEVEKSKSSDRISPSLDDLEAKKQLLLDALEGTSDATLAHNISMSDITENDDDILNKTNDTIDEVSELKSDVKEALDNPTSTEIVVNNDEVVNNDGKVTNNDAKDTEKDDNNDTETKTSTEELQDDNIDISKDDDTQQTEISQQDNNTPDTEEISLQSINTQETFLTSELTNTQESAVDTSECISGSQQIMTDESATMSQLTMETELSTSSQQVSDSQTSSDVPKTPDNRTGHVKDTDYGTPVMNVASPYDRLPSTDKFAKDICDVLYFENLPNSTGKYKKISALLRKVKCEVDRIHDDS